MTPAPGIIQRAIYCVAVGRGSSTRYFWGETLKAARYAAGKQPCSHVWSKFVRGREWHCEVAPNGKTLASRPLTRRGRHVRAAAA